MEGWKRTMRGIDSEALLMDDFGALFFVLLTSDPHGLELTDARDDGATQPAAVLTISW